MSICCRLTQLKGTQRERGREREGEGVEWKPAQQITRISHIKFFAFHLENQVTTREQTKDTDGWREGQTEREGDRYIHTDRDRLSRWKRDNIKWHCPKTQRTKPKRTRTRTQTQTRMRCRDPQKPQCQWRHNNTGEGRLIAVNLEQGGKGEVLRIVLTKH